MTRKFAATCDVAVPTTVHRRADPTTATEGVRSKEEDRNRGSFELGGQARLIRVSTGVGQMID